jgi:nitrite reductase (cytochrome c-552)
MRTQTTPRSLKLAVTSAACLLVALVALPGCTVAEGEEAAAPPAIPAREHDPAVWGTVHPAAYQTWLATAEARPAGKSPFKRGFDGGEMYDKLSEFPFMPLLFNGWGFGLDYNEPRGHAYMLIDQSEIDPARVKAGGACLTCKSPYAQDLYEQNAAALFGATYADARAMIPEEHRDLGVACIDCHDNETMALATRRWTADAALAEIGLDPRKLTPEQQSLMVCGQCHCTYSVVKADGESVDVDFPWEGSEWGAITVENIIDRLQNDPARTEWTQQVTGMELGFIRHPDVEFYTAGSRHAAAGVVCADCHMLETGKGAATTRSHDVTSPLKRDMAACQRCHTGTADELRAKVVELQERNLGMLIDAGYRTATVAKLIELANQRLDVRAPDVRPRYEMAARFYRKALYRTIYMGAENSVGFHNPQEGVRILTDAARYADDADQVLRELLASKGVSVPAELPLELRTYLDGRGEYAKGFQQTHYVPDPTGRAQKNWPASLGALLK